MRTESATLGGNVVRPVLQETFDASPAAHWLHDHGDV